MRAFILKSSDIDRCPIRSLSPYHYREDGTCLCPPDRNCPGCGGPDDHYPDCLSVSEGGTMPDVRRF